MSEAECQLISDREMPDLEEPMDHVPFNLGFKFGSPTPVNFYPPGKNGLHDVFGNVWCWLSDDFYPLPGFEAHPWYEDFSSPFFDRYHGMLRGGSWASTGTSASKFYRLWFRRHFLQHAGFRVALDAPDEE